MENQNITQEEFKSIFKILVASFQNFRAYRNEAERKAENKRMMNLQEIYYTFFKEETKGNVNAAFMKAIEKEEFFPRVATLIKHLNEIKEKTDGITESQISAAEKLLTYAIRKYANSGTPVSFEDKGVQFIVGRVGWDRFENMSCDEYEKFLKWDFPKLYREFYLNPCEVPQYFNGAYRASSEIKKVTYAEGKIGLSDMEKRKISGNLPGIPEKKNEVHKIEYYDEGGEKIEIIY